MTLYDTIFKKNNPVLLLSVLTGCESICERLRLSFVVQSRDGHRVLRQRHQIAEVIGVHISNHHLQNRQERAQLHFTQLYKCIIYCLCKTMIYKNSQSLLCDIIEFYNI